MRMNFKEPHITNKIYIIPKYKYQNKIQLPFQIIKSFILKGT